MMNSYKDIEKSPLVASSYRDIDKSPLMASSYRDNERNLLILKSYSICKAKSFMTGGPRADERRCCSYDD